MVHALGHSHVRNVCSTEPPTNDYIKVNVDDSSFENPCYGP